MQGKTVVITGATSGLGAAAARRLGAKGARIVMVARDPARAEAALDGLRAVNAAVEHAVHYADLSRLSEMKRVAAEIAAAEPRIDVLVNNAGALFAHREVTEDGLDKTFATNHMAYFVLTNGLLERLNATPDARVVSTASAAHRGAKLDFDDLQSARRYRAFSAYGLSKLCNILFTRELARRLRGTGVTANCLHPGFVDSRFGDQAGGLAAPLFAVAKRFAISPERGSDTLVWLASSSEVAGESGGYFDRCAAASTSSAAKDDGAAARLWAESERIAGLN